MILPENFDFTQGKLQDYVDCPYRFYLRYILRTKWPALVVDNAVDFESRLQAGAHFHHFIQQYLLGIPEARLSEMVAAFSERIAPSSINTDLQSWWEGFLTYVPPLLEGQRYAEMTLTSSLAGQRLVAKYDLILVSPNDSDRSEGARLTIFDWKTSQKTPRVDWLEERIQTRLYRLVLADASPLFFSAKSSPVLPVEPDQITMNYWFTSQPSTPVTLSYSQSSYTRDQTYLAQLVQQICTSEPDSFHRTSDLKQCRFCVYRSHCDRGVAAGPLDEFTMTGGFAEDIAPGMGEADSELAFEDIPEIAF